MEGNAVRKTRLLFVLLSALIALPHCAHSGPNGQSGVVGGTAEPNYRYPWVVSIEDTACHGVLIHPKWVLTAAHCVKDRAKGALFKRTDPYTGVVYEGGSGSAEAPLLSGIFTHPMFVLSESADDIALIRLDEAFTISPYIQTVGLPTNARQQGVVGTVASSSHTMLLPPDKFAIFRAPIPLDVSPKVFTISTSVATGSLCPGDSGSGFVTNENGRAMVRGIAATVYQTSDCKSPSDNRVDFVDVFAHRE